MELLKIETDDTLRELKIHKDIHFPFQYYLDDFSRFEDHSIDWHWHNELEFASVSSECVNCLVGAERITLQPGEGIFFNSGTIHRFESTGTGRMPGILFTPDFLAPRDSVLYKKYVEPVISSSCKYLVFRQGEPWHRELLSMLYQTYAALEQKDMQEYRILQHTLQLWRILYQNIRHDLSPSERRGGTLLQARLQIMMQYIHGHYSSRISLQDIADAASISKSEALHCFRTGIGSSPVAYLIDYRMNRAADLLLATHMSVSKIALECGIDNTGYFCRQFKQVFGMTPSEFRKKESRGL